jgi:hypothetical protein
MYTVKKWRKWGVALVFIYFEGIFRWARRAASEMQIFSSHFSCQSTEKPVPIDLQQRYTFILEQSTLTELLWILTITFIFPSTLKRQSKRFLTPRFVMNRFHVVSWFIWIISNLLSKLRRDLFKLKYCPGICFPSESDSTGSENTAGSDPWDLIPQIIWFNLVLICLDNLRGFHLAELSV